MKKKIFSQRYWDIVVLELPMWILHLALIFAFTVFILPSTIPDSAMDSIVFLIGAIVISIFLVAIFWIALLIVLLFLRGIIYLIQRGDD